MDLKIGGLTPFTSIDFPGRLAAVLYCQGCAWQCGYCHNPELICTQTPSTYSWQDIQRFLRHRQGLLDGVVFSGGEPSLQKHLIPAINAIKAMGFAVGMHCAGIHLQRFRQALPLLDWVGFDIKGLPCDIPLITGTHHAVASNWNALQCLVESGIDYEVRTTIHSQLTRLSNIQILMTNLKAMGVTHYRVQLARNAFTLDDSLKPSEFAAEEVAQLRTRGEGLFSSFQLRTQ